MRQFLALLFAAGLVFGMAACSTSEPTSPPTAETSNETKQPDYQEFEKLIVGAFTCGDIQLNASQYIITGPDGRGTGSMIDYAYEPIELDPECDYMIAPTSKAEECVTHYDVNIGEGPDEDTYTITVSAEFDFGEGITATATYFVDVFDTREPIIARE